MTQDGAPVALTTTRTEDTTPPAAWRSGLQETLASGAFAVTAEVVPPRGASMSGIKRVAGQLSEWIDAANITDGQGAVARMSSWAGSLALQQAGVEPVMQFSCRDRNRIALQADLLGAHAVGIPNVLCLTGDHPRFGDHPDAKPVFDMDSIQLLWTARTLRDEAHLLSGNKLSTSPGWFIGAVENPNAAPQRFRAERLGKKIAAGAQFIQTQFVFDVEIVERWMQQVRDLGLEDRCGIMAGVGPIRTERSLEMLSALPGVYIPESVRKRVLSRTPEKQDEDAVDLCSETIERLRAIPGIRGVHIIASNWEGFIPEVLKRAGIGNRRERADAGKRAGTSQTGGRTSAD